MGRNLRLGCLILACLLGGCGQKGDGGNVRVQGKVTLHGAALPGGTLAFVPDVEMGGRGDIAVVEIKADGTYTLDTPPGWYRITINTAPAVGLAARYADPELCQLSREVKSGSVNTHDFPLN